MYYRNKCKCKCIDNLRLFFFFILQIVGLIYRRYCLLLQMTMYYRNKCKCIDNLRLCFHFKRIAICFIACTEKIQTVWWHCCNPYRTNYFKLVVVVSIVVATWHIHFCPAC